MKKNNKGFTLAELLIVVAIIAVLTAIAIPVFTTQLEKSREATDLANMRSAYALVQAAALTQDSAADFAAHSDSTTTYSSTGTVAGGDLTYKAVVTLRQTQTGWQTTNPEVGGISIAADAGIATATIEWKQSDNKTTLTLA